MKRQCDSHSGVESLTRNTRANAKKQMFDESEALRISLLESNVQTLSATSDSVLSVNCEPVNTISDSGNRSTLIGDELTTIKIGTTLSSVPSQDQSKLGSRDGDLIKTTVNKMNRREMKNTETGGETLSIKKGIDAGEKKTVVQHMSKEKLLSPKQHSDVINKNSKTAFNIKRNIVGSQLNRIQLEMSPPKTVNQLNCSSPVAFINSKTTEKNINESTLGAHQSTNYRERSAEPGKTKANLAPKVPVSLQHFKEDVNFLSGENKTHLQYFKKAIPPGLKKTNAPRTTIFPRIDAKGERVTSNFTNKVVSEVKNLVVNKAHSTSAHPVTVGGQDIPHTAGNDRDSAKVESTSGTVKLTNSTPAEINDKVSSMCSIEHARPKAQLGSGEATIKRGERNASVAGHQDNELLDVQTVVTLESNSVKPSGVDCDQIQQPQPKASEVALSNAVEQDPVNAIKQILTSAEPPSSSNDDKKSRQNVPPSKNNEIQSTACETIPPKPIDQLLQPADNTIRSNAVVQDCTQKVTFPFKEDTKSSSKASGLKKRSWCSAASDSKKSKTDTVEEDLMNVVVSTDGVFKRDKGDGFSPVLVPSPTKEVGSDKTTAAVAKSQLKVVSSRPAKVDSDHRTNVGSDNVTTVVSDSSKNVALHRQTNAGSNHSAKISLDNITTGVSDSQKKVELLHETNAGLDLQTKVGSDDKKTIVSNSPKKVVLHDEINDGSDQRTKVSSDIINTVVSEPRSHHVVSKRRTEDSSDHQNKTGLNNKTKVASDSPKRVVLHRQTKASSDHHPKPGSDNKTMSAVSYSQNKTVTHHQTDEVTEVGSNFKTIVASDSPSKVLVHHQTNVGSNIVPKVGSNNTSTVATERQSKDLSNLQTNVDPSTEVGLANQSKTGSIGQIKVGSDDQSKVGSTLKNKVLSDNISKVASESRYKNTSDPSSKVRLKQTKVDSDSSTKMASPKTKEVGLQCEVNAGLDIKTKNVSDNSDGGKIESSHFKKQVGSGNHLKKLEHETKSAKIGCNPDVGESLINSAQMTIVRSEAIPNVNISRKSGGGDDTPSSIESIYAIKNADKAIPACKNQEKRKDHETRFDDTPNKVVCVSNAHTAQENNSDTREPKSITSTDTSGGTTIVNTNKRKFQQDAELLSVDKCNEVNPVVDLEEQTNVETDLNHSLSENCNVVHEPTIAIDIHKEKNEHNLHLIIKQPDSGNQLSMVLCSATKERNVNDEGLSIVNVMNQNGEKKKGESGSPASTVPKAGRRGFRNKPVGQINVDTGLPFPTRESVAGRSGSISSTSTDCNTSIQSSADEVFVKKSSGSTDSIMSIAKCLNSGSTILGSVTAMQMSSNTFIETLASGEGLSIDKPSPYQKEHESEIILESSNSCVPLATSSEIIPVSDSVQNEHNNDIGLENSNLCVPLPKSSEIVPVSDSLQKEHRNDIILESSNLCVPLPMSSEIVPVSDSLQKEHRKDIILESSNSWVPLPKSAEIVPVSDSVSSANDLVMTVMETNDAVQTSELIQTADSTHCEDEIDSEDNTAIVSKLNVASSVYVSKSMIKIINESQFNSSKCAHDKDFNNEMDVSNNIDNTKRTSSPTDSSVTKRRRSGRIKKSAHEAKETERRNLIEDHVEHMFVAEETAEETVNLGLVRKRSHESVITRNVENTHSMQISKSFSNMSPMPTVLLCKVDADNSNVNLCKNRVESLSEQDHVSQVKIKIKKSRRGTKSKRNTQSVQSFEQIIDSKKSSGLEIVEKSETNPELVFDKSRYTLFSEDVESAPPTKSHRQSKKTLPRTKRTPNDFEASITLEPPKVKKVKKSKQNFVSSALEDLSKTTSYTDISNQCTEDGSLKSFDLSLKKAKNVKEIDPLEEAKIKLIKGKSDKEKQSSKARSECTALLKLITDRSVAKKSKVSTATNKETKAVSSKRTEKLESKRAASSLIVSSSNCDINPSSKTTKAKINAKRINLKRKKTELCMSSQQSSVKEGSSVKEHKNIFFELEETAAMFINSPETSNIDQTQCLPVKRAKQKRSKARDQGEKCSAKSSVRSTERDHFVSALSEIQEVSSTSEIAPQSVSVFTQDSHSPLLEEGSGNSKLPLLSDDINLQSSSTSEVQVLEEIVEKDLINSDENCNIVLRLIDNFSDSNVTSDEYSKHHPLLLEIPATRIDQATTKQTIHGSNLVFQITTNHSKQLSVNPVESARLVLEIPGKVLSKLPDDADKSMPLLFQLPAKRINSEVAGKMHQDIQLLIEIPARTDEPGAGDPSNLKIIVARDDHKIVSVDSKDKNTCVQGSTSANEERQCASQGLDIPNSSSLDVLPCLAISAENDRMRKKSLMSSKRLNIVDNSAKTNEEKEEVLSTTGVRNIIT